MKIDDDHQFHGAALMQIAEDPHFTAINAVTLNGHPVHNAFRVNDNIGVYLKYSSAPVSKYKEYRFTFTTEHLELLKALATVTGRVFVALVCIRGRELCSLPYERLLELIERRRQAKGANEDQYVVPVVLPVGKSFRVYINAPGEKGTVLGKQLVVARSDFPKTLFT
jgi:hypothetical protein